MAIPKVPSQTKGGSRFYVDEASGERQPGVTSIINVLAKPGLRYWFAKTVAEEAAESYYLVLYAPPGRDTKTGTVLWIHRPGARNFRATSGMRGSPCFADIISTVVTIRSTADSILCYPTASFSSVRERCGDFALRQWCRAKDRLRGRAK